MNTLYDIPSGKSGHNAAFEQAIRQLAVPVCRVFGSATQPTPARFEASAQTLNTKDSAQVSKFFPNTVKASGSKVLEATAGAAGASQDQGKRVAVIGGGNSGVEAAIDLAGVVDHVTLFEFMPELRADAVLQRKLESLPNVKILKNVQVTEVKASNDKVSAIVYKDRTNDSIHEVALEGVFVQIGLVPNTDFLKDSGITLVRNGEIQVDVRGQTSMEGVFAAGDCTTSPYKQIIIAAGDGAKAALAAFDHLIRTSAPK